jgi:hypothetical protein
MVANNFYLFSPRLRICLDTSYRNIFAA